MTSDPETVPTPLRTSKEVGTAPRRVREFLSGCYNPRLRQAAQTIPPRGICQWANNQIMSEKR
jgi:hypothetical protein